MSISPSILYCCTFVDVRDQVSSFVAVVFDYVTRDYRMRVRFTLHCDLRSASISYVFAWLEEHLNRWCYCSMTSLLHGSACSPQWMSNETSVIHLCALLMKSSWLSPSLDNLLPLHFPKFRTPQHVIHRQLTSVTTPRIRRRTNHAFQSRIQDFFRGAAENYARSRCPAESKQKLRSSGNPHGRLRVLKL